MRACLSRVSSSAARILSPSPHLPASILRFSLSRGFSSPSRAMEPPRVEPATKPKLVVVLGTTGAGKSKLAVDLALRFSGEVVSADSMQVYRGADIATAKVILAEQKGVPHHLLDILSPLELSFNAAKFVAAAVAAINDIVHRRKLPIVVGGTHQYLEALLWSNFPMPGDEQQQQQQQEASKAPPPALSEPELVAAVLRCAGLAPSSISPYEALERVDPLMARKLNAADGRKVRRSLELFLQTGAPHSRALLQQTLELRYAPCVLWVHCERDALYSRLDSRVDDMVTRGLVAELAAVRAQFLSAGLPLDFTRGILQSIGLKEFDAYLRVEQEPAVGGPLLASCIADLKKRNRNYARTQLKWIEHHFRTRLPIYQLDSTDPERWSANVAEPAVAIVEDFLQDRPPRVPPLPVLPEKAEVKLTEWQKFHCRECDRELNGRTEWEAHLRSRGHKALKRKANKLQAAHPAKQQRNGDAT